MLALCHAVGPTVKYSGVLYRYWFVVMHESTNVLSLSLGQSSPRCILIAHGTATFAAGRDCAWVLKTYEWWTPSSANSSRPYEIARKTG